MIVCAVVARNSSSGRKICSLKFMNRATNNTRLLGCLTVFIESVCISHPMLENVRGVQTKVNNNVNVFGN